MESDLVDNLLATFNGMEGQLSLRVKEERYKDHMLRTMNNIVDNLNTLHPNVRFSLEWGRADPSKYTSKNGYSMMEDYKRNPEDSWSFDDEDEEEPNKDTIDWPLDDVGLKINFTKREKCSLNHVHSESRYYCYSMATVSRMMSYCLLNPVWLLSFVKEFIPNFFEIDSL